MIPNELFRTSVKQLCVQYEPREGIDSDIDFLKYLDCNYNNTLKKIAESVSKDKLEIQALHNALFVFAVGLLTYGRIEVTENIINNIPSSGHVQRLALSLKAMMPMPDEIDPIKNSEKVSDWLHVNLEKLKWNSILGIYDYAKQ